MSKCTNFANAVLFVSASALLGACGGGGGGSDSVTTSSAPVTISATNAKEVADYLVKEVTRVEDQQSSQSSNITKIATLILAALNIANDNIELKKNHSDLLRDISERSANLIRALDAAING